MANTDAIQLAKRASALSNPTSATVFKQADDSTKAASVSLPVESGATSALFHIRARGRATTGTTSNFKATLQFTTDVTSTSCATAANNTDLLALTNRSLATVTRPWYIDAWVIWDSTSQRLSGQGNGFNAETIETANAAITALTGIDLTTRKCGIVVSAIFGTSNASNSAVLDELIVEQI
jgi:hypothetical protein